MERDEEVARLRAENEALRAALAEARGRLAAAGALADAAELRRALERALGQAARHGTPSALLDVAVDGGPEAEAHVAAQLAALIRSGDVLARAAPGRLGLILDRLDHNSAIETAERLARCVAAAPPPEGQSPTIAIGTAAIFAGDEADEVIARARRNLEIARDG